MTRTDSTPWLARAAGWLPAIFWVLYTFWNTMLLAPPALGRLTGINLLYLLMLPAVGILTLQWRWPRLPGRWAYLAFLAWVALGAISHDPVPDTDLVKGMVICLLPTLAAAQIVIGGRNARTVFTTTVMATALGLSIWTLWYAFDSGFRYRSGVPINPNFVATIVGPGLLIATAHYLTRDVVRRGALMALILLCFYASLLLGSRGVLIAVLASTVTLIAMVRPSFKQTRSLFVGALAMIVVAQLPILPYTVWQTGWETTNWLYTSAAEWRDMESQSADASDPLSSTGASTASAPVLVPPPLHATAAASTALGRFGEKDTGSFNLRYALWRAGLSYVLSSPTTLFVGGGMGMSGLIAWRANAYFRNAHNTFLQVLEDFGLIGLGLLAWLFWDLMRTRAGGTHVSTTWLPLMVFWLVTGLTATVTDLHVFWISLGVAAAASEEPHP
jgi:O-antigen ligase